MRFSPLYLAFVTLGCSSAPPASPRTSARVTSPPAPPPVIWDRFGEISTYPAASAPFPNDGHPGAGAHATVRVSPDALAAYRALVTDSVFSDGVVVALFHDGGPDAAAGPVYVMRKLAGAWEFLSLGADGRLPPGPERARAISTCPHCHEAAVADHLFGLPRPPSALP